MITADVGCPAGTEWSADTFTCTLCDTGTYRSSDTHGACLSCPEKSTTYTKGSTSSDACDLHITSKGQPLFTSGQ